MSPAVERGHWPSDGSSRRIGHRNQWRRCFWPFLECAARFEMADCAIAKDRERVDFDAEGPEAAENFLVVASAFKNRCKFQARDDAASAISPHKTSSPNSWFYQFQILWSFLEKKRTLIFPVVAITLSYDYFNKKI